MFDAIFKGNTIKEYITVGVILLFCAAVIEVGRIVVKKTVKNKIILHGVKWYIIPISYLFALLNCIEALELETSLFNPLRIAVLAVMVILLALFVSRVLDGVIVRVTGKRETKIISRTVRGLVWIIAAFLLLDNLDVSVNSLIAGLGITGVAVAFAAQVTLENLFCYFSIILDGLVEVGDFVEIGDKRGFVQAIGSRATRIRLLHGEELIVPNKLICTDKVINYKLKTQRRMLMTIGVIYETPASVLESLPGLLKSVIDSVEHAEFRCAHIEEFNKSSIDFEIEYYISPIDHDTYALVQNQVYVRIKAAFDERNISFAYPTFKIFNNLLTEDAKPQ